MEREKLIIAKGHYITVMNILDPTCLNDISDEHRIVLDVYKCPDSLAAKIWILLFVVWFLLW